MQRSLARTKATLRKIHTTSRLGLRASRGSEYSRLGSSRKSRSGSKPLRFFWITPSRVPMLPERRRRGAAKQKPGSGSGAEEIKGRGDADTDGKLKEEGSVQRVTNEAPTDGEMEKTHGQIKKRA